MIYKKEQEFGKQNEKLILEKLNEYFKTNIILSYNDFEKYDGFDANNIYEIKTRRIIKNAYSTTLLTYHKVCNNDKPLIIIFNFVDYVCYIKYDEDKFNTYEKKLFCRKRPGEKYKDHIFIPVKDLTIICKK